MSELALLSTLGLTGVLREVLPRYPGKVAASYGPTAAILERIAGGESGDAAILTAEGSRR
ncbi:hypothetical protein ACFQU2_30385 [Siccirubricoccus deserti]